MPKDRYQFDKKVDKTFDDYLLENRQSEEASERRAARLAKAEKKLSKKARTRNKVQSPEERAKKKRKVHVGRLVLYVALVVAIFGAVGTRFVHLQKLQSERRAVEAQLKLLQEDEEQKKQELKELDSEEYIEEAARSELHMIKNGEVMYVVTESDAETKDAAPSNGAKPE